MSAPLSTSSLVYFVKVAEHESFTRAAEELRVAQPSISAAIRKLEEELETTLFLRGRQGVKLTATGEALLQRARHILRALEDARTEIHELEGEPRGSFLIGVHPSLAAYFLPKLMASFPAKYPRIQLALWNGNSADVERAIIESVVDLGLVVNPGKHPDLVVQELFRDRVEIGVAGGTGAAARDPQAFLAERPLIFVPALRQTQYILGALAQSGIHVGKPLPCQSLELVKSLVLDGAGAGILPRRVAGHGVPDGAIVALAEGLPSFADAIALVRRFDLPIRAATRIVLDVLAERGRDLTASGGQV